MKYTIGFRKTFLVLPFLLIVQLLFSQNNLLRNGSFEHRVAGSGANVPTHLVQFDGHCRYWKGFPGTTTDWYDNTPGFQHGATGCDHGELYFDTHPAIPDDDGTHYAGVYPWPDRRGEALQQRMTHKLRHKTYTFSFSYFISCDTMPYQFDLFFGTAENDTSLHIKFDTLDRTHAGQWHTYSYTFSILPPQANDYDWIVWVFDGDPGSEVTGTIDGSYMFVDDMKLIEQPLTCTDCDPDGLISWNQQSIRPYMTPYDNDGIFDEWCVNNVNNISWYELWVIARWGPVYFETNANANGYENYSICWDGRNANGQLLPYDDTYQIVLTLGNCGTQVTHAYSVYISNDLAHNAFSVAQNYVPPLFGLETPPTHYRDLHLYGGPYYGTHDWYACDTVFVGLDGGPRTPYFWAASTSNLGFYGGSYVSLGQDFDVDPGADIDIQTPPVQCCPQMRLANPDSTPSKPIYQEMEGFTDEDAIEENFSIAADSEEMIQESQGFDEFSMDVVPNPADETVELLIHVPDGCTATVSLWTSTGTKIMDVGSLHAFLTGDHQLQMVTRQLPTGLYFLRGQAGQENLLFKLMVIH